MKRSKIKTTISSVPVPVKCGCNLFAAALHIGPDEGILISDTMASLILLWHELGIGPLDETEVRKVTVFNQKDVEVMP